MISINVNDLKDDISEALDRMVCTGERVLLQRQDKEVAALITLEELELLEKIEGIKNETDLNDAPRIYSNWIKNRFQDIARENFDLC